MTSPKSKLTPDLAAATQIARGPQRESQGTRFNWILVVESISVVAGEITGDAESISASDSLNK
jgi:hypothetical protein